MSEEEREKKPGFKERFLATRLAFERVLFADEEPKKEKKKSFKPMGGVLLILLAEIVMLSIFISGRDFVYPLKDAMNINLATKFADSLFSGNWQALFKPETLNIKAFIPPLYYLTYAPFLKIFNSFNTALVCVNSLYLAVLLFSVFFVVKEAKGFKAGWTGALFVGALPFVLNSLRHPDPAIATMAFVASSYAAFILSKSFEKGRFLGLIYGLSVAMGLLTDKFFIIYALPTLVPFLSSVISFNKEKVFGGFVFICLTALPWYLRNGFYYAIANVFSGDAFIRINPISAKSLFWSFGVAADSMHIIMFVLGLAALVWMYFALFNSYEGKKPILIWLIFPCIIFSFLFKTRTANLYPALIAISVAVGVMTPKLVRVYFWSIFGLMLIVNQAGIIGPQKVAFLGNIPFAGLPKTDTENEFIKDIVDSIQRESGDKKSVDIVVIGKDEYLNTETLSLYACEKGFLNLKFRDYDDNFKGIGDFLIRGKSKIFAKAEKKGFDSEIKARWFKETFADIGNFRRGDFKAELFKKKALKKYFGDGVYRVKKTYFGRFYLQDVVINLSGFNRKTATFKKARFQSSYAGMGQIDIYGLDIITDNFAFITEKEGALSNIIPLEIGELEIKKAKITDYSIARYIEEKNHAFKDVEVELNKTFRILARFNDKDMFLEFAIKREKEKLEFALKDFVFMKINPPNFFMKPFRFEYSLSKLPFRLDFKDIQLHNAMMEIK